MQRTSPLFFENLFRPIFEQRTVVWSVVSAALVTLSGWYWSSNGWHYLVVGFLLIVAALRSFQCIHLVIAQVRIMAHRVDKVKMSRLARDPDYFHLGKGFEWGTEHAQRAYDLGKMSTEFEEMGHGGLLAYIVEQCKDKSLKEKLGGRPWIHGIGKTSDVDVAADSLNAHVGIVGSTGSGKTRLLELLVSQSLMARLPESVVVIDPKGDKDLHNRIKKVLALQGRSNDYYYFDPARPQESCRLDVLANFNRSTEIASRISALIASDQPNDPFVAFCWRALGIVNDGMLSVGKKPSLKLFRKYMEGGVEGLLVRSIEAYFESQFGVNWRDRYAIKINTAAGSDGWDVGVIKYYKQLSEEQGLYDGAVDSLLNMAEHDREHFGKMVGVLLPLLTQLTAGSLEELMSPDYDDLDDKRPIVNGEKIVNGGKVLVVALDSLSDSVVGNAIGSITCADIVAVAGQRQNYMDLSKARRCALYIDEAAAVLNRPIIELLNKGRSSYFRVILATQTIPDFIAKLGSEPMARQVLGNINTLISLKISEGVSAEYCVEAFGKTAIKSRGQAQNYGTSSHESLASFSGGFKEQLTEVEGDVFSASLLANLPNLEYVARLADGRIVKGKIPFIEDDVTSLPVGEVA